MYSDRGGQYIKSFRMTLFDKAIQQSMSRLCGAAVAESCWSRLKAELVENGAFRSLEDAQIEVVDYIDRVAGAVLSQSKTAPLVTGLCQP